MGGRGPIAHAPSGRQIAVYLTKVSHPEIMGVGNFSKNHLSRIASVINSSMMFLTPVLLICFRKWTV